MFKKQLPIIFIGLSIVVAVLVLGWSVFVKQEVVEVPVVEDSVVNDENGKIIPDDIAEDDNVLDNVDNGVNDNDISEIDISDWKTYRNEEYGFEVKYPENWELIYLKDFYPGNNGVVLKSSDYQPIKDGNVMHKGEIYIHGMDNQNSLSTEKLFSTFSDSSVFWFDKFDHTDVIVNGNNGVLFDYIMENSPPPIPQNNIKRIGAYIQGNKKVIDISYLFLENPKREIFDKILYSFDFVESMDASAEFITYTKNDQIFSVSKSEFKVLDKFNTLELKNKSEDCGTNKSERYFEKLLSCYLENDSGTEYRFKYQGQTQDSGIWIVTIIPNKIGYTNLEDFKNDFDLCEAGSDRYPFLVSEKYLLFVSSCGTGYDDDSGLPHGCDVVRKVVEPTIMIK